MAYGGIAVFDGNSLTSGQGATGGNDYPSQVAVILARYGSYTKYNFGVGAQTTTDMASDAATQIDTLYNAANPQNIVVPWEITNELYFGTSAATAYANYVSYCQARLAAGFYVIALTVLPRSNVGTPGGFETDRQAVNTSLRANWATFANALADVAADARIGDAGDETDTTYYDGSNVHLNNAGYAIVAQLVAGKILGITLATLTLQPDETTSADASIINAPDANTGTDPDFDVGHYAGGSSTRRGLVKFDVSSIPPAATVTSATLSLWVRTTASTFSSSSRTVRVFRIRAGRDWVETQALWGSYKTANAWTTPGCGSTTSDREGTAIGTLVTSTAWAVGQQVDIALTPGAGGVQDWVDGTLANNGMILISDTESTDLIRYRASADTTAAQRPRLVVEFTTPLTGGVLYRNPLDGLGQFQRGLN